MWYETTGTYDGRRTVWVMHKSSHLVCKRNHQWANSTVGRQRGSAHPFGNRVCWPGGSSLAGKAFSALLLKALGPTFGILR